MKLIAIQQCWNYTTVPPTTIAPGEPFDLPKDAAESLIQIGAAKAAEDEAEPVAETQPEPEVKPTRKRKSNEES